MKKLLTSIFCSALFVGAMAQADIKMRVVPTVVQPGTDEVELAFEMINPDQEVKVGNMNIYLPEGFTVLSDVVGEEIIYYVDFNTARTNKRSPHTIVGAYQSDGSFMVVFKHDSNLSVTGKSGTLFTLTCSVDENVETGLLSVDIKNIVLAWGESAADRFDQEVSTGFIRVKGNETASLTIPEGGFGTLCLPFAAELKDGMKAYTATGVKNGEVVMVEQSGIAANTPLLIEGVPGDYTFTGDNSAATETDYTIGALTGMLFPMEMSAGHVLQQQSAGLGFYRLTSERTVPAYRCVLNSALSSSAPAYLPIIFGDETNGINSIANTEGQIEIYTLDGKRVSSLSKGKVYIINGIKTIIK